MSHDFHMTYAALQQKMASVPRVHCSRILGLALRSRAAAIRPPSLACASRWRHLSAAPCLARSSYHRAGRRDLNLTGSSRLVLPVRGFASEGITVQELEDRVVNVLKLFDKVNPDKVRVDAHFMKDLGMDSLDAVEVVMAFEDEFGIEISDEEAEKIFSCNDAIELLKTKLDLH